MLRLCVLGSLELGGGGRSTESLVTQPKRMALLVYLAVARPRGYHRRDTLVSLFWPELDHGAARNALSQALHVLRRSLPQGVVQNRGVEEVRVDPGRLTSDVEGFDAALAEHRWADALALYRGDFLTGFHVPEAPGFEDWLAVERERLRELAAGAAWSLAHERIAEGEVVEAERIGQRALLFVPTDESPVRAFVRALADAGDRGAALRFYEKFATLLERELEVGPAPETVAVAAAVRREVAPPETRTARRLAPVQVGPGAAANAKSTMAAHARTGSGVERPHRTARRKPTPFPQIGGLVLVITPILLVGALITAVRWVEGRTGGPGTLIGEGLASPQDEIIVADLSAAGHPTLGMTAAEWLRTEIDQSDVIRVVGPVAVGGALRRMGRNPSLPVDAATAREIAVRDGYPFLLAGEVTRLADQWIITVRLECPDGTVVGRFNQVAPGDSALVQALDRLGEDVRSRVGESRGAIRRSPPLEQVTTSSLEALWQYTAAVRLRDWEGRPLDAIPHLERAIELDSTFAAAHLKLSVTLNNLGIWRDDAWERENRLWEIRGRLTAFERLKLEDGVLFGRALRDSTADECALYEPGFRLYDAYVREHPDDARAWHNHAWHLERMGRLDDAIAWYRRLIREDHAPRLTYGSLLTALMRRGDEDAVRDAMEERKRRFGEDEGWIHWQAVLAMRSGDYGRADSLYATLERRAGPAPATRAARGRIAAVRGQVAEAEAHFAAARSRLEREGDYSRAAAHGIRLALIRLVAWSDTTGAVAAADSVLELARHGRLAPVTWIDAGMLYALAGDRPRTQAVIDSLVAFGHGGWSRVRGRLRAALAAAGGEPEPAIQYVASARLDCVPADGYPMDQWNAIVEGRAHEAAGRPLPAIRAYRRVLGGSATAADPSPMDAVFLFDTLERMGGLHEELGQRADAATHFARAAALWTDADPVLRHRARGLLERGAVLAGGRWEDP